MCLDVCPNFQWVEEYSCLVVMRVQLRRTECGCACHLLLLQKLQVLMHFLFYHHSTITWTHWKICAHLCCSRETKRTRRNRMTLELIFFSYTHVGRLEEMLFYDMSTCPVCVCPHGLTHTSCHCHYCHPLQRHEMEITTFGAVWFRLMENWWSYSNAIWMHCPQRTKLSHLCWHLYMASFRTFCFGLRVQLVGKDFRYCEVKSCFRVFYEITLDSEFPHPPLPLIIVLQWPTHFPRVLWRCDDSPPCS